MKKILENLQLILAEKLLGWAMSIAPKDHPDSQLLYRSVAEYLRQVNRP